MVDTGGWVGFAADLGASNGRTVLGRYDGKVLGLEEISRFANVPVSLGDTLYWDFLRLYHEVVAGLGQSLARGVAPVSAGIDTWGVDFGFVGRGGELLANPRHYRDHRNREAMEDVLRLLSRAELHGRTGVQTMQINTVFQLRSLVREHPELVGAAHRLLLLPDLFNFYLTGEMVSEFTHATTTQLFNPLLNDWDRGLIKLLDLPERLFCRVVKPLRVLGNLRPVVVGGPGTGIRVVNVGEHDTASAVYGLGRSSADFVYISSGTWSLVGVLSPRAVINEKTFRYNFTNEGGVNGDWRLLKNVVGLWLLQEAGRQIAREGRYVDTAELVRRGAEAQPLSAVLDPDASDFLAPANMVTAIRDYCRRTSQPVPGDDAQVARTILESLALKYRWVIEKLEEIVGHPLGVVRMVGGGVYLKQLCQWTADATGRVVVAGPAEATVLGNLCAQLVACGEISGKEQAEELLERSCPTQIYSPGAFRAAWDEGYGRLLALMGSDG